MLNFNTLYLILIILVAISCGRQKRILMTMNTYYSELLEIFEAAYVICDHSDNSFSVVGLEDISDLPLERDGSVTFPFGRFIDGHLDNAGDIKMMYDKKGKSYFTFQYRIITQESEDHYVEGQLVAEGQIYEDRGRVRCKCDEVRIAEITPADRYICAAKIAMISNFAIFIYEFETSTIHSTHRMGCMYVY